MSRFVGHFCPCFRTSLFVRALSAKTPPRWIQIEPCDHCDRGLGAIRAVCRARQTLNVLSFPRGWVRRNPRVFCTRGSAFVRIFFCFILANVTDDIQQTTCGEHNATTLPPGSSSRQHHARACAWRVLAMLRRVAFFGACHLSPHHAFFSFLLCCHCVRVLIDRVTLGGNIGTVGVGI